MLLPTDCQATAAQVASEACATPSRIAGQPSKISEKTSRGGMANRDDQTTKASMSTLPIALEMVLPTAQLAAAPRVRTRPSGVADLALACARISPRPAKARTRA